jgi:hypothetical protein
MSAACGRCGQPWRPGARFCPACGAPAPVDDRRPSGRVAVLVVVTAVAAAVVAGGAVLAAGWWRDAPAAVPAPATAAPHAPATAAPVAPPTSRPPGALLLAQVDTDRSVAESLVGSWVPQIGSKAVGTRDDGVVYGEEAIWEQYLTTRAKFPSVVLIRSDDYSSFRRGGYWVILVAAPYGTAAGANGWCESAGLPADDCFAKRLSHSEGPQGNTAPR